MDRRGFVVACAGACAGVVLGGCVSLVTHPVLVHDGRVRLSIAAFPDLLAPRGAIRIQPARHDDPVYVLAVGADEFVAVSPICTHRGCVVDVQGVRLVCPCHGSTYTRRGEVLRGPAERNLTRYPTVRDGDALVIDLATRL